jgi:hypothetical protein
MQTFFGRNNINLRGAWNSRSRQCKECYWADVKIKAWTARGNCLDCQENKFILTIEILLSWEYMFMKQTIGVNQ